MPADDNYRSAAQPPDNSPAAPEEERIQTLLRYLKTLADLSRLRILGAVATQERTVEDLAVLLDLKAPTVSHHLARLRELDLIHTRSEGVTRWNSLNQAGLERLAKLLATPAVVATLAAEAESGAWERKTLRDFLDPAGRLKEIPAQRKKRQVILRWLADHFEWGREYTEAEVNEIIKRRHPDTAYLRRELIAERLMARESGRYWRSEPPSDDTLHQIERRLEWGRIYTLAELTAMIRESARDVDATRRELLARGVLAVDHERYWLARPPQEKLQ